VAGFPVGDPVSARNTHAAIDLAAIRAVMSALTEQVKTLVGAVGMDGAAKVRRVPSKAADTLDDAAEAGGQMMESVGREMTPAQKYAAGAVRHHPYQSVDLVIGHPDRLVRPPLINRRALQWARRL
jgi:ElaB/YqjD/DUF883 family membrane-anchored ribosome-binding protein